MEFYLRYDGTLKSNAKPKVKHELRKNFHKQLKSLCSNDALLKGRTDWDLSGDHSNSGASLVSRGNFMFAPLITSKLSLLAEIDITLLWGDLPGQIIGNGDIDNKLKTIFDALSLPPHLNQIENEKPEADEVPFFLSFRG